MTISEGGVAWRSWFGRKSLAWVAVVLVRP
ncbi:PH domain-containing protein [Crossiella sp. NPDC003009]